MVPAIVIKRSRWGQTSF